MPDDYSQDTTTTGRVAFGVTATGDIETSGDFDWFAVELVAGRTYVIGIEGRSSDGGTLGNTVLRGLYDAQGVRIDGTQTNDGGDGGDARLVFTATQDGTHYIAARGYGNATGTYTVRVTSDDTPAGARDLGDITDLSGPEFPTASLDGDGDRIDYFKFTLSEAKKVGLGLRQQDADADLFLEDADGNVLDLSNEAGTTNEQIEQTLVAGTYYVRVEAQEEGANNFRLRYGVAAADPNRAPAFAETSYVFVLSENADGSAAAVALGTVKATDPEAATVTYSIAGGNDAGLFAIDSVTGALSYKGTGEDYETGTTSYALTVRASDGTLHSDLIVTVNVSDVPEQLADGDSVRAGATDLGDITDSTDTRYSRASLDGDLDVTDYFRFTLTEAKRVGLGLRQQDANADLFLEDVEGNALYSSARDGTASEWISTTLVAGTYYVRVAAREEGANDFKLRYGVGPAGRNAAPAFASPSYAFDLAENTDGSATAVALGTVKATDPEAASVTYSLAGGNDAGLFEIGPATGALWYKGSGEDFESGTKSYALTVRASDGSLHSDVSVTVNVTDLVENDPAHDEETQPRTTTAVTGMPIKSLNFSDPFWVMEGFKYGAGWAGLGFGLTGSQRGAPERIQVAEVDGVTALRLQSAERNDAWHDEHPSATGHPVYGEADFDRQDDFFFYRSPWTTGDDPYLMAQVYLGRAGGFTALRMPMRYENATGNETRTFPGIFYHDDRVLFRGPGRFDISREPSDHQSRGWVTLGMTVTDSGDIIYVGKYGTHSLAELFADPDFRFSNSDLSLRDGFPYFPVTHSPGEVGMFSQEIVSGSENAIAYMEFGTNLMVDDTAASGLDDYAGDTSTTGSVAVGAAVSGEIETTGDWDWFAVALVAGRNYQINLGAVLTADGALAGPRLGGIYDADGHLVADISRYENGLGGSSQWIFTPWETGVHYIAAGADPAGRGHYELEVTELPSDDDRGGAIDLGDITELDGNRIPRGSLDGDGDRTDYFKFALAEAKNVRLGLRRQDANADLFLEDAEGNVLYSGTKGGTANEWIDKTLLAGTYYVRVEAQEVGDSHYVLFHGVDAANPNALVALQPLLQTAEPDPLLADVSQNFDLA